jgi:uncharacterized protein YkwD
MRVALIKTAAAAIAAVALLPAPEKAAAARCADASRVPTPDSLDEAVAAVECEINQRRRQRGLPRLDVDSRLREASQDHARDMVRRGYFSHTGRDGRSTTTRLKDAGYIRAGRRWAIGETLAWGTFWRSTPRRAVTNWMRSPSHRRVLLDPRYRDIGVGGAGGAPARAGARGATYAAAFGVIR